MRIELETNLCGGVVEAILIMLLLMVVIVMVTMVVALMLFAFFTHVDDLLAACHNTVVALTAISASLRQFCPFET